MAIKPDNVVTLGDGRALGYAEWGDPEGAPILHFHGTPGSRLEGATPAFDAIAARLGLRVLGLDRPGVGRSDPKPRRTILDWAADVAEFADLVGLSRFSVYGVSGGGPYAAACAYRIAHRLRAAGIVSGIAPMGVPDARRGLNREDRAMFFLGRHFPWGLRWLVRRMAERIRGLEDRAGWEAFLRGEEGVYLDLLLASRPWGFDLARVPMVMNLWFGGPDVIVPAAAGRYLARSFARSEARYYPDEGPGSLLVSRYEEILTGLAATGSREGDTPIVEC